MSPIPILHEDQHLLVIDKPAGTLVVAATGHSGSTVVEVLQRQVNSRVYAVHRLDEDTTGVLLLARDQQTKTATVSNTHVDLTGESGVGKLGIPSKRPSRQCNTPYPIVAPSPHYRRWARCGLGCPRRSRSNRENLNGELRRRTKTQASCSTRRPTPDRPRAPLARRGTPP